MNYLVLSIVTMIGILAFNCSLPFIASALWKKWQRKIEAEIEKGPKFIDLSDL